MYWNWIQHAPAGSGEPGAEPGPGEGAASAMGAWDWAKDSLELAGPAAALIAAGIPLVLYLLKRRARQARASAAGRPWVRRPYLTEPFRTNDPRVGERLVEMVRAGAGVPLVCSQRKNRLANLLRWTRLYSVLHDTTPSPVYVVAEWRHIPASDLDGAGVYTGSASSVLLFHLAEGERREHFSHSANVGLSGHRRPIVLAKVEDLRDPTAWVRRVDVNAAAAGEDHQTRTGVSLPSSASVEVGATATSRVRQKDIPPGAIWLICDNEEQAPPSPDWGDKPDSSKATPRPSGSPDLEHQLERQHRWWWTQKAMMLFIAGLVPAGFTLYASFAEEPGNIQLGLRTFSVVWFIATAAALVVWLWTATRGARLYSKWHKNRETQQQEWTGGTARGVYLGRLLKDLSFLEGKGWPDLWERKWPKK